MKQIEKKHPAAIRWFHWVNFPILAAMIWTGMWIYWASDTYYFGPFHLFPDWVYRVLHWDHKLAQGMAWHFFLMWIFALNGLAYVLYTAFSGEWRYLLPGRNTLREGWQVLLHDLGLRRECPPRRKFNGAQQIAYTGIILMGFGSLVTGLAIYKYTQVAWLTRLLGGYEKARFEHFLLTLGYCAFFLTHVAQVIRAGWNNFRAMLTGYEVVSHE